MKNMKYGNNIQMNSMIRASKEVHNRRMREVRFIVLMSGCIITITWLMVHMCFIGG